MKGNMIMILLLLVFIVIVYLYFGNITEQFSSPSQTSLTQQSAGTSKLFNWPSIKKLGTYTRSCPSTEEETTTTTVPESTPAACNCTCTQEATSGCANCDITLHPDIDKYVLKSSVPPCPDLRNYALKSSLKPDVDMSKYILKSEMEACPKPVDLSDYVHKNSIPACPPQPSCPICPQLIGSETNGESEEKGSEEETSNGESSNSETTSEYSSVMETAINSNNSNDLAYNSLCGSEMEACDLGSGAYASYNVKPITTVPVDNMNPKSNYPLQRIGF
jgi:hypothetical protein